MIKTLEQRIMNRTEKTDTCWLWRGCQDKKTGHGSIKINKKMKKVHRVSYELLVGPIPENLVLRHLCNVSNCINPEHLKPGTQSDNVLDSVAAGTHPHSRKTHCKHGHEYTDSNTRIKKFKKGFVRVCRTCEGTLK